ncbi:MAG: hypothetical protein SGJ02_05795 [bacterium]|nr:hypothetical protein [bacterium]
MTDKDKQVQMNVATANNLTIPPNSSAAFPIGTIITAFQYGTGQTTLVAGAGVTIRSAAPVLTLANQYSFITLVKIGTNEWGAVGGFSSSNRVISAASYTTNTGTSLDINLCDLFIITAQAGALLFNNPTGTAVEGQQLLIRIKDNGTARALTYGGQFRASTDLALPSTTIVSRTLYMKYIRNNVDSTWDLVAFLNNFA